METRCRIACLMYHEVTDDSTSSGFQRPAARRYAQKPALFRRHLDRIERSGMVPARVDQVELGKPGRHLMLTFDDGGRSALHVADQLAERGWPAHFFIVTERIGARTFLGPADIRRLRSDGHLVGSHSHTHPDIFRDGTRPLMLEEWRVSAAILEDLLGEPCSAAAVPGGDISPEVLATARDSGFRYLFTSEPWVVPRLLGGCWVVGRVCLKAGVSPDTVAALTQFRGWGRARFVRALKGVARYGLGPLYRMYVAHTTRPVPPVGATGA
ncbi:MAG: polysaccharide deacetylase family protein [Gemmatimonadales bacterium]